MQVKTLVSSIRALMHVLASQLSLECRQLLIGQGRMWSAHLAVFLCLRKQVFKATLQERPVLSAAVSGRRGGLELLRHCFDGQVCDEMPKGSSGALVGNPAMRQGEQ